MLRRGLTAGVDLCGEEEKSLVGENMGVVERLDEMGRIVRMMFYYYGIGVVKIIKAINRLMRNEN
jgi:hypothetical protein